MRGEPVKVESKDVGGDDRRSLLRKSSGKRGDSAIYLAEALEYRPNIMTG